MDEWKRLHADALSVRGGPRRNTMEVRRCGGPIPRDLCDVLAQQEGTGQAGRA